VNVGGTSMYFGLEQWVSSNAAYGGFGSTGQYGADAAWQRYLTEGTGRGDTYDLPGGAYGSLTTSSFSLEGYSYTDKPTLYFNYWLETEEASGTLGNNAMRDAARVFLSDDGGLTWDLVATNASPRNRTDSELPLYASVSTRVDGAPGVQDPRQQIQELYESASWRQARIDLGEYAGATDLRLRFDFTTAGVMDPGSASRTGQLPALSGSFNANSNDGNGWRAGNNAFEGFYVDDIIVGFAERGEMVTAYEATDPALGYTRNADAETVFFDVGTPEPTDAPSQVLFGPYQLEIRRGTEYVEAIPTGASLYQLFDTNDRLVPSQGNSTGIGATVGDQNQARQQGQFVVENNMISYSEEYGISFDAGSREPGTETPYPGVARNLPTLNSSRLVPGAVARNNVINEFGFAGILFSGDSNGDGGPTAVVPFGRIVNNTIYGGQSSEGVGVMVTENAGPTLLNNLFANLATGVEVDATSRPNTVIATSAFYSTASSVTGASQTYPAYLTKSPFVNPMARNFYLVGGTAAIDSSLNALQDRPAMVAVTSPVGIPQSPIIAPKTDLYGQTRWDDPGVTNLSGLGSNVFNDRGAIERVDFVRPLAKLVNPGTGDVIESSPETSVVTLVGDAAKFLTQFVIQLQENGSGIDPATVVSNAIVLVRNGETLVEGTDYLFQFVPGTNRITLAAAAVFQPGEYEIRLVSLAATGTQAGALTDRANNTLLPNRTDGTTAFAVALIGTPGEPRELTATVGNQQVELSWAAAPPNGSSVTAYEFGVSTDGRTWEVTALDGTTLSTVASGLQNGVDYHFRVRAKNSEGWGPYSAVVVARPFEPETPMAPLAVIVEPGDSALSVAWEDPANATTSGVLEYEVEVQGGGETLVRTADGNAITVNGLINGVEYRVRVRAVSSYGLYGEWSNQTAAVVPHGQPLAPAWATVTPADKAVRLTWTAADGNGLPVTGYRIELRVGGQISTREVGAVTSYTVSGLVNGLSYEFRIAALTAYGLGTYSAWSTAAVPSAGPILPT
jgi:hypothetical protein